MEEKISPELRKYKEEFDFLHKKIGELEWKKATMYYNKKALLRSEIDNIDIQLENYTENMQLLLSDVKNYVTSYNSKREKVN